MTVIAALVALLLVLVTIRLALHQAPQPAAADAGRAAGRPVAPLPAADVAMAQSPQPAAEVPAPGPKEAADEGPPSATPEGVLRPWQPPVASGTPGAGPPPTEERVASGLKLADANRPVEARHVLTSALDSGTLPATEADFVREAVGILNRRLVFGPEVISGDPFARHYVVQPGELLGEIVKTQSLLIDWRFILRINRMSDARSLRAGRRLKLVTGPFHAVIVKSEARLDLYLGSGADRVFVASYPVGLGEYNSTPSGRFRVRPNSKLVDPAWFNPRTGERFDRSDPDNPIGERWIGLQGIDEATRDLAGYGIHGTIDPNSVGRQSSMGCIRMLPEDVEIIFEVLTEKGSTIEVLP